MPKNAAQKVLIRLDLLKPQSNPEKIWVILFRWILSSGRFILVFVELVVLVAFLTRFKLDADIASTKEAIDQQVPYIQSAAIYEDLIRQTQLGITTIKDSVKNSPNYTNILKKIADQTPQQVILENISMEKQAGKIEIQINGQGLTNNAVGTFILGLKQESTFSNVNITNIGLDEGVIKFTITFSASTFGLEDQQI